MINSDLVLLESDWLSIALSNSVSIKKKISCLVYEKEVNKRNEKKYTDNIKRTAKNGRKHGG